MINIAKPTGHIDQNITPEANLLARFIYLSWAPQTQLLVEPEITWFTTNIAASHYMFNIVLRANFGSVPLFP